ncbi:MAG TPA: hypothetical protein VGI17_16460 [Solirubrobacterales bacterium]
MGELCEERFRHHAAAFDVAAYSFEWGIYKPEPAAYAEALYALESTPRETVLLDDSAVNVQAAVTRLAVHRLRGSACLSPTASRSKVGFDAAISMVNTAPQRPSGCGM